MPQRANVDVMKPKPMDTQDPEFQCHIASALDDFNAGSKKCSGAPSTTVRQGAVKLEPAALTYHDCFAAVQSGASSRILQPR
jgi:hypothetical protein